MKAVESSRHQESSCALIPLLARVSWWCNRRRQGGGVPIHCPQLTDTNYGMWPVKMKIILRSLRCWRAIEGKGEHDPAKDEDAFAALSQSVPDSMVMALTEHNNATEAWEGIRRMRVGEDRVKKKLV
ncbi:hypothetical protein QYE76_001590 [Lolium multiflorum]|uniref:DUF4219 domain-containing protein n=1 Tax=Lolium multiflorum TaxID=4521 RepID=A0AAD8RL01_LOLMU|nr:hypothetical protein QYE76_001590 [Lolium multiflorum]